MKLFVVILSILSLFYRTAIAFSSLPLNSFQARSFGSNSIKIGQSRTNNKVLSSYESIFQLKVQAETNDSLLSFDEGDSENSTAGPISFPLLLWRFSRPHTLIGSAVAIPALHCLAAPKLSNILTPSLLQSLVISVFPALLINIYITGLNQITDVEIDKINKPYLPIAAGLLSVRDAKLIVCLCLLIGLLSGVLIGTPGLNLALWGSALLGTIYSVPPFRLKRFPLLAATCIVAVRGTIINVGFFAHAQQFLFGNTEGVLRLFLSDRKCLLSSLFFGIFGIVIALMKGM